MTRFHTLVYAETLLENLKNPHWMVFDTRHDLANVAAGRNAYREGHIPGAIFQHLDDDLSGIKTGINGRHPLPDRQAFTDQMASLGVNANTQIVIYDAQGSMMASRLWWMLRWIGHQTVAVLDGGWSSWKKINGPEDVATPEAKRRGNISLRPSLVATVNVEQVMANLASREKLVVDARAADRFRGENETIDPVGGHIPGAHNRPFRSNLEPDERFKDAGVLRTEWNSFLHGWPPEQVIAQCGSGVTACHNLLALEIAGLPGAALYAGSWSEWCADPARPVER